MSKDKDGQGKLEESREATLRAYRYFIDNSKPLARDSQEYLESLRLREEALKRYLVYTNQIIGIERRSRTPLENELRGQLAPLNSEIQWLSEQLERPSGRQAAPQQRSLKRVEERQAALQEHSHEMLRSQGLPKDSPEYLASLDKRIAATKRYIASYQGDLYNSAGTKPVLPSPPMMSGPTVGSRPASPVDRAVPVLPEMIGAGPIAATAPEPAILPAAEARTPSIAQSISPPPPSAEVASVAPSPAVAERVQRSVTSGSHSSSTRHDVSSRQNPERTVSLASLADASKPSSERPRRTRTIETVRGLPSGTPIEVKEVGMQSSLPSPIRNVVADTKPKGPTLE